MVNKIEHFKQNKLLIVAWLAAVMFFATQFIFRLWPGLIIQDIMANFGINATQFGTFNAFYYCGYAGMQIPIAILLDKYGSRLIIPIFIAICCLGNFIFALANSIAAHEIVVCDCIAKYISFSPFYLGAFGRFLVGAGSAAAFLGVSKVVSEFFPKKQYAKMISLSFTFGLIGAVFGGRPMNVLISEYGFNSVSKGLVIYGLILAIVLFFILDICYKNQSDLYAIRGEDNKEKSDSFLFSDLKFIITSPKILSLALANMLMVGALEGFADVWGVTYLVTAYGVTKSAATGIISLIFLGMIFGGPLLTIVAKYTTNYTAICICGLGISIIFIILLTGNESVAYESAILPVLLFAIGIFSCYQVIVFSIAGDTVSSKHLGITVAFLNCANMFGGSLFHPSIGKILDMMVKSGMSDSYNVLAYRWALGIIPVCAFIGTLIVFMLQKTITKREGR